MRAGVHSYKGVQFMNQFTKVICCSTIFYSCFVFSELPTKTAANKIAVVEKQFQVFNSKQTPLKLTKSGYKVNKVNKSVYANLRDGSVPESRITITVDNGLIKIDGNIVNNYSGNIKEINYIIENDGKLYVNDKSLDLGLGKSTFHSSLVNEEWPIGAGNLTINDGKIIQIDNLSGHFMPGESSIDLMETRFRQMGADFSEYSRKVLPKKYRIAAGDEDRVNFKSYKALKKRGAISSTCNIQ